jgi:hemerythrin-like domain-containing protein
MKNEIEFLLERDHESLHHLLIRIEIELQAANLVDAFPLLDRFWARLAMHIRAENLHLFPALTSTENHVNDPLLSEEEVNKALSQLRADHDYFMKELGEMMKKSRALVDSSAPRQEEIDGLRRRLAAIKERLETHNRLEEERVYNWAGRVFEPQTLEKLTVLVRQELENLPPRFRP